MTDITPREAPARLRIRRDQDGMPHIDAASQPDAMWGLGWAHACDRGMQLLVMRILGRGEAAQHLDPGDQMVDVDRFFRRMAFRAATAEHERALSERAQRCVTAYAGGVNARLARRVPWELALLLRYKPDPWTPADSVLLSRVAGYVSLAQSQGEVERLVVEMVQAGIRRDWLEELFPGLLAGLDEPLVRDVSLGERMVPESVAWLRGVATVPLGSNNWVLSGARTRSGFPLLANDIHLEANRLPGVWYEVGLRWPGVAAVAVTMPGLPAILVGRTERLAWGPTYAFIDATDSWVEDCRDGQFRRGDRWVPFRQRHEVIRRKGKAPVEVVFHENDHGVLDGDARAAGRYLATRWTSAQGGAPSLEASVHLPGAATVAEGMTQLARLELAFSWVLADREGHIGFQMSGLAPKRRPGVSGLVPLPGWDPANDWQGLVAPEDLPRCYNPPAGFFVTANEDLNEHGRTRVINMPMGAYRADRIRRVLDAAAAPFDVEATARLQDDLYSTQAEIFLDVLRPLLPDTPAARALRDWDLRYDITSVGAPLFEAFYRTLRFEVFGRALGSDVVRHLQDETGIFIDFYANIDRVLLDEGSAWYAGEPRDRVWRSAAAQTLAGDPADRLARWGEVQTITMRHLLLGGKLPGWLGFDHGPLPLPGGRATIHQGQVYRSGGRDTCFTPSFRMVADLGEEGLHTALAGGPSDRRFSPWYRSGLPDWIAGRLKYREP